MDSRPSTRAPPPGFERSTTSTVSAAWSAPAPSEPVPTPSAEPQEKRKEPRPPRQRQQQHRQSTEKSEPTSGVPSITPDSSAQPLISPRQQKKTSPARQPQRRERQSSEKPTGTADKKEHAEKRDEKRDDHRRREPREKREPGPKPEGGTRPPPPQRSREKPSTGSAVSRMIAERAALANSADVPSTTSVHEVTRQLDEMLLTGTAAGESYCILCVEPINIFAVGACNHRDVCATCSIRQRVFFKNPQCCICKTEMDKLILTKDRSQLHGSFKIASLLFDKEWDVYFDGEDVKGELLALRAYKCRICNEDEGSLSKLRKHLQHAHNSCLCDLCVSNGPIFMSEQRIFNRRDLQTHMSKGDDIEGRKFTGHPQCKFCSLSFYDGDHLYHHMHKNHETCHVCRRQEASLQFQYYADYEKLTAHFRSAHYVCDDPQCRERGSELTTVFATAFELKAHTVAVHMDRKMSRREREQMSRIDHLMFAPSSTRREEEAQSVENGDVEKPDYDPAAFGSDAAPSTTTTTTTTTTSDERVDHDLPAEEVQRRNKALIARMKEILGDDKQFSNFKGLSQQYRKGSISPQQYFDRFTKVFGAHSLELFDELIALLPDADKRRELRQVYMQGLARERDFPTLGGPTTAGSVRGGPWGRTVTPSTENDFPSLGASVQRPVVPEPVSQTWARTAGATQVRPVINASDFPGLRPGTTSSGPLGSSMPSLGLPPTQHSTVSQENYLQAAQQQRKPKEQKKKGKIVIRFG